MAKGNKSSKKVTINSSDWDNNKKFDLINEVRQREQLWNYHRDDYHKRDLTDKNWEDVATALNCPADEAREVWRNLRVYFNAKKREAGKKKSGQGLEDIVIPKWVFYKEMEFLASMGKPMESVSNLDSPGKDDNSRHNLDHGVEPTDIVFKENEVPAAARNNGDIFEDYSLGKGCANFEPAASAVGTTNSNSIPSSSSTPVNTQKISERRMKRKRENDQCEALVGLMNTVQEAFKTKTAGTGGDDLFVGQILNYLKSIPESFRKEEMKLRIMNEVIQFKFNSEL